ncbi:MAG: hypothetical protein E7409_07210, partial [Ruminococcaceae bacterium]|nr:hypothetical protein [Oscillospiraceae bacterium]
MRRVLSILMAVMMVLGTMGFTAFAAPEEGAAAFLAYDEVSVENLPDAFTQETNPRARQVLMAKNWTGDIEIDYPGFGSSFYLNGYALDGQLKLSDLSILNLYGIEPGNDWAGSESRITASGIGEDYTLYQTSNANINISGTMTIKATEEDGIAIYAEGGKIIIGSAGVTVDGNIKAVNPAIIKISDGTYLGEFEADNATNLEITGGKFAHDPSAYIPAGYEAVLGEDEMYTIIKPEATLDMLEIVDGKYILSTPSDVVTFREVMSKESIPAGTEFKLANNIDMTDITLAPAGNDTNRFYGNFDGNHCKISNITIQGGSDSYVAFFGNTSGATIKDLTLENITVSGGEYTAGLVGRTRNTTVTNCKVIGDIAITGSAHVGGIVGGGVTNVTECAVIGNENSSISGVYDVGGIAGLVSAGTSEVESNSVSNINITAEDGYAGGVAGRVLANAAGNNLSLSYNEVEDIAIASGTTYEDSSALIAGYTMTSGVGNVTYSTNSVASSTLTVDGVESDVVYAGVEGDANISLDIAKIGDVYYTSLEDAIADAADVATEETPVTVQLLPGEFEVGNVQFPAVAEHIIIKGAADHATTLKNSAFRSADGSSICYNDITIDGIVFDNSYILFTGWRADATYKDWTITNCKFYDIESEAAVFFNLSDSVESEAMENFSFTNNVIDGVTGASKSGMGLNVSTGDITITGNVIKNVNWNAIQLINVAEDATVVITDNELQSDAEEGVVNLYNMQAGITLKDNTIITNEGQPAYAYFEAIEADGKVYGSLDDAISNAGESGSLAITTNKTMNSTAMNTIASANDGAGVSIALGENVLTVEFAEDEEVVDYSELIEVPSRYTLKVNEETGEDGKTIVTYQLKKKKSNTSLGVSGGISGSGVVMVSNYTVTFEANGGSAVAGQLVQAGGKATEPVAPEKEGYIFDGWYADAALTEAYDFDATVGKNITIYAKWTEKAASNQIILT